MWQMRKVLSKASACVRIVDFLAKNLFNRQIDVRHNQIYLSLLLYFLSIIFLMPTVIAMLNGKKGVNGASQNA